tara:strand:+ start:317 stop:505 length:189 start_codon:yes stop_codon:yes gene_type:complete
MFLFDQCQRCRGTVTLVSGLDGNDLQCVNYGFSVPVENSDGMTGDQLNKVLQDSLIKVKKVD